jgi:hypothetical protein
MKKKLHQQYHFRPSPNGLQSWDVLKLVDLSKDFPVFEKKLSEIKELKENYWFGFMPSLEPKCEDIIQHAKQIYEADLSYPIILCSEGRIMDGMHRVCKAKLEGHETILAVQFTRHLEPDNIGKQPDELYYQ